MSVSTAFRHLRLPFGSLSQTCRFFSTTPRASLARMAIIGRLAAEPELTATSTGREMIRYALGTSYGPKDDRQTSWFRVACFDEGPRRDFLLSLPKGTLMHLDAEARMQNYEDENGKKQSRLSLVQKSIEVLSKPNQPTQGSGEISAAEEPSSGLGAS